MKKIEISKEQIVKLIKQGFTGVEIAARLGVSVCIIGNYKHKYRILTRQLLSQLSKHEDEAPERVVAKNPRKRRTHLPCMIPVKQLKHCYGEGCYLEDCPIRKTPVKIKGHASGKNEIY